MKPLTLDDLIDLDRYETIRPALREAVIAHKAVRRVAVGERVSLVFEDRQTLRWQVLEMARVEQIRDPRRVQDELDVYNTLLPGADELSATLFVEITDLEDIKPELDRLVGIDEHLALVLGDAEAPTIVPAHFDTGQMEAERISAVQYVRFQVDAHAQQRLADLSAPAWLRIDHPHYRAEAKLEPSFRRSACLDFSGGATDLVDWDLARKAPLPASQETVIQEIGRVRVVRPHTPLAAGHLCVEPREAIPDLASADPDLVRELQDTARRLAATLEGASGPCRIELAQHPLRWHLLPSDS